MPEIPQKPPSSIKIRTLQSDVEEMRQSGGEFSASRILGKPLEKIAKPTPEESKEAESIFQEEETSFEVIDKKKSRVLPIIVAAALGAALLAGLMVFVVLPKLQRPEPQPTPSPTLQYSSLFQNFTGEKVFLLLSGKIDDFEKIIAKEFQTNYEPNQAKELVFLKDGKSLFTAENFLRMLYDNFPGVSLTDIPNLENAFSVLIYNRGNEENALGYVFKLNTEDLPAFAIANLKSRFSTVFERFIEEHQDMLASQYLQDVGSPFKPFLTVPIGPINTRYLKFSTGSEFYYGFYQNYLIIATNQETLRKVLEFLLPKI